MRDIVTARGRCMKLRDMTKDDHIIELEVKISHQEVSIDELKQTVYEQHLTIERLEKELKRLKDRIDVIEGGPTIGPGNEKPPHY
jgi:SlyX protein